MIDPRVERYAKLLVERCIDVQPRWQVMIQSSPLARPLVDEVVRHIAGRGAYALLRVGYDSTAMIWVKEADPSLLAQLAPIERFAYDTADAFINIHAPENTRDGSDVPPDRRPLLQQRLMAASRRRLTFEVPWVGCQYPTPALAQDAGMVLQEFEDFLFGACLLDWDAEGRKMRRLADRFDAASEVRITGADTDISVCIEGREAKIDDGHVNMPGGEFFYSPVEDATEGVVTFAEFPAVYQGSEVTGVRLEFKGGRIVDASARSGEEYLIGVLDTDEGARVLGELGIGCNPGVTRHMKNTLYDEKIYGTVHLAVGAGFPFIGGKNESNVHWDMVKDLRTGGAIYLDGVLVQKDGQWLT